MIKFHTGYEIDENDYHDVMALAAKFGIEPPEEYRRFPKQAGPRVRSSRSPGIHSEERATGDMRTKQGKTWSPYFRVLWEHSRARPLAVEDHPWGDVVFKVGGKRGKIFAFLGHPEADDVGVTVKPSPEELGGSHR